MIPTYDAEAQTKHSQMLTTNTLISPSPIFHPQEKRYLLRILPTLIFTTKGLINQLPPPSFTFVCSAVEFIRVYPFPTELSLQSDLMISTNPTFMKLFKNFIFQSASLRLSPQNTGEINWQFRNSRNASYSSRQVHIYTTQECVYAHIQENAYM